MKQIRKQKWIVMAITLMMCIAVYGTKGSQTVSAATSSNFEYQEKADGTIEITGYNKNDSDVTIPEKLEGKSVTSIGDDAFADCENLTNVTLPSNVVKGLGKDVFAECDNIIFYDVKKNSDLEKYAAKNGYNVAYAKGTTLTVKDYKCKVKVTSDNPKNLTVEYKGTTDKKSTYVNIPGSITVNNVTYKVTKIADNAFSGNKKLVEVCIGNNKGIFDENITTIGKNAFKNCKNLQVVYCCSKNLKKIGANAFSGDKGLWYIELATTKLTKKSIGKNALKGTSQYLNIGVPKKKVSAYKQYFKGKGNKKVRVSYYGSTTN